MAGCTASDGPATTRSTPTASEATPGASANPSPAGDAEAGGVTDADTCAAIGDVLTIQFNAEAALRDGRMQVQEQQAWNRLATRVFDRAPTSDTSVLGQTVRDLQAKIDLPSGTLGITLVNMDDWATTFPAIMQLCKQVGAEVVTEGFVGG